METDIKVETDIKAALQLYFKKLEEKVFSSVKYSTVCCCHVLVHMFEMK